jgi:hypothetical protein
VRADEAVVLKEEVERLPKFLKRGTAALLSALGVLNAEGSKRWSGAATAGCCGEKRSSRSGGPSPPNEQLNASARRESHTQP